MSAPTSLPDPEAPYIPPLLYLCADDVRACMPTLPERLALAERVLEALVAGAEVPPKAGVHPRAAHSLADAMPALLKGADESGANDLLGMKWILGVPANAARFDRLAAYHALVLLNDARTGVPTAIVDGGPITAQRTAAISGVSIARFAPPAAGRPPRAALIGAGVQGHAHVPVLGHVLPGVDLTIFDRNPARAEELAALARTTAGIRTASVAPSARSAVQAADVVVTAASFGPVRQVLTPDWLSPAALVVAVDYATHASAALAREADLFLVDERRQFLHHRSAGLFDNYPDPSATIGEALIARTPRPPGRVLVSHLGVGLADVVFADAVLARAVTEGRGIVFPR